MASKSSGGPPSITPLVTPPSKKSKKKNKQNKQQQPQQQQQAQQKPSEQKQKTTDQPKPLTADGSTVRADPNNGELLVCKPVDSNNKSLPTKPTNPRAPLDPSNPSDNELNRLEAESVHPLLKPTQKFPRAVYHCRLCVQHLDSLGKAWDHVDSNRHRLKSETQELQRFVAVSPSPTQAHAEGVGEHLVEHTDSLLLDDAETARRIAVANQAIEAVRRSGPGRNASLYGSLAYALATKISDVNLCLSFDDSSTTDNKGKTGGPEADFNLAFDRIVDSLTSAQLAGDSNVKLFASIFESQADLAPTVLCTDACGVIYRFSVKTGHLVHTSKLIGAYVSLDDRCRRLCLALRCIANLAKADSPERGTLPPHAYYLMVVHYLQQKGLLPVLNSLPAEAQNAPDDCFTTVSFEDGQLRYFSAGLDRLVQYWQPTDTSNGSLSLGRLWIDMLRYYSVPQQDSVVSVTQLDRLLCSKKDWTPKRLNIEDPFRPRMNMGRGVASAELLDYILMQIRSAYRYYAVPQLPTGPLYKHFKIKTAPPAATATASSNAEKIIDRNQKLKITPLFDLGDVATAASDLVSISLPPNSSTIDIVNAALTMIFSPSDKVTCSSLGLSEADLTINGSSPAQLVDADIHQWLVRRLFARIVRRHLARDNCEATPAQVVAMVRFAVLSARKRLDRRLLKLESRRRRTTTSTTTSTILDDNELAALAVTAAPTSIEEIARQIVHQVVAECLKTVSVASEELDVNDVVMNEKDFVDEDIEAAGDKDAEGDDESVESDDDMEDAEIDEELAAEGGVIDSTEPDYYHRAAVESVAKSSLRFAMDKRCLVRAPPPQLQCASCGKAGHLKDACTEYEFALLPSQLPGPCPPKHLAQLNQLLLTVPADFEEEPIDIKKRNEVKDEILALLRVHFPDARLDLFGSCCNGFGFKSSDLDICLTFDSCPELANLRAPVGELITRVAKILKGAPSRQFYNVLPITQAKVPIVKFRHRRFDYEGDVSLYNRLAAANTKMLRTYAVLDRRVRDIGYIVKVFAKSCQIGDASRGSLSSYAYMILVLHYLQSEGLIPCLQELYDGWPERQPPRRVIDGWNAWFQEDRAEIAKRWRPRCDKNVAELWLGFLRYYLEFDWRTRVVTIRRSGPLLRLEKLWSTPLAIEDPFDLSHNLASGMTKKMAWFILTTFHNALKRWCTPLNESLPDRAMKEFLFSPSLCPGDVPKDRGCKRCGKIGHIARDCGHEMRRANQMDGIKTPLKDFQKQQSEIDQQSRPQLAPAEDGPAGGPAILYMRQPSSRPDPAASSAPHPPSTSASSCAYQPVIIRAPGLPDLLVPLARLPAGPEELRSRGSAQAFPVFNWAPEASQQQQQQQKQQTIRLVSTLSGGSSTSVPIAALQQQQQQQRHQQGQPVPLIQKGGGGPPMPLIGFQNRSQHQAQQQQQQKNNRHPFQQGQSQQKQRNQQSRGGGGGGGGGGGNGGTFNNRWK